MENIINNKLGERDKHGMTYQQILDTKAENEKLKQKISDLESLMQKQEEFLEMKNIQIAGLKQHIAELESKNTVKPRNGWICVAAKEINGQEYVKLEDFMRVVNDLQEQNRLEDDGK